MGVSIGDFLAPLDVGLYKIVQLARKLEKTYRSLAKESQNQFLPTPISDSILRPGIHISGRYLAIDIGGTNLRVGFIELIGSSGTNEANGDSGSSLSTKMIASESPVRRWLEKSWPIGEQLKHEKAEDLFAWVGECIAEVVQDGLNEFPEELRGELPLGVTFSFPMIQHTLSDATLMSMGKGFAITSNLDLGNQLRKGYAHASVNRNLPHVKIVAIVNDAVATFVSFVYQLSVNTARKPAMGLIVGTGNNATVPLKLSSLHPDKRHKLETVTTIPPNDLVDERIVINCEWSINGTGPPLKELNMVTRWDEILDRAGEAPGFMPFEQMSAGRYLGELGRLIFLDYATTQLNIDESTLPERVRVRHGITTTFLGKFGVTDSVFNSSAAITQLNGELPPLSSRGSFQWTSEYAETLYKIGKAIQLRAAGMTAAAIIGLLACAGDVSLSIKREISDPEVKELIVGYTGGCIVHFQDYLHDCQEFLDGIVATECDMTHPRVVLQSCHDGGIIGAGVLAGTVRCLGVSSS